MTDARILELEALVVEEGFRLPMTADLITYFEARGYVVDLTDGSVCQVDVTLSPNVQALCHLYGVTDSDIGIDLFDYDAELEDLRDGMEEEEWIRRGCP